MARPEEKIVKIIDTTTHSRGASVEQVGDQGALIVKSPTDSPIEVDIKETTDFEGAPVTVGTTAVEITFTGVTQSIQIEADCTNSGFIYIGKSNVTNAGANAMSKLEPGSSITIDLNDSSNAIYAVATVADQIVYKMALL